MTPHLLRKSIATDIAWRAEIQEGVRRRFMGHRAADDVYGRIYTLDHPELAPMIGVAQAIDAMIDESIGTLLVPTGRRAHRAPGPSAGRRGAPRHRCRGMDPRARRCR